MTINNIDVIVVGNIGIDTNVFFNSDEVDFSEKFNFTKNYDMVGQAGGYACRSYARLNVPTAFVGYVGADYSGEQIRRVLNAEEINVDGLLFDPMGTSRSINFIFKDGRCKHFFDGKGHMTLHPPVSTIRPVFSGEKLIHFNPSNWARELLPFPKRIGVRTACDIQEVTSAHDPYLIDFVEAADYLFFSVSNDGDPTPLIKDYLSMNPDLIIVSGMGANGCALGTKDGIAYYPAYEMELPVVDTNGAGEALAVGFLTSFVLDGMDLERSVRRGQIAARYKCAQKATSSRMITRELLDHYDTAKD